MCYYTTVRLTGREKSFRVVGGQGVDYNPGTKAYKKGLLMKNYEKKPQDAYTYPILIDNSAPVAYKFEVTRYDGATISSNSFSLRDLKKGDYKVKIEAQDVTMVGADTILSFIPKANLDDYLTKFETFMGDQSDANFNSLKMPGMSVAGKWTSNGNEQWRYDGTFSVDTANEGEYFMAMVLRDSSGNLGKVVLGQGTNFVKQEEDGFVVFAGVPTNNPYAEHLFLSEPFAMDCTVPTFSFSLGALFDDFLAGLKEAVKMSLMDNLSRDLFVNLALKHKDTGDEMMGISFKINGIQELAKHLDNDPNADLSKVSVVMVKSFAGVGVAFVDGEFSLTLNLQELMASEGLLEQGLDGFFEINIEDNAGNNWMDGFADMDLEGMIIDQALQALMQGLGISDKSLIVSPGFSAGGVEIDPAKYLLVGMGVNGKTVPIFPSDEAEDHKPAKDKIRKATSLKLNTIC